MAYQWNLSLEHFHLLDTVPIGIFVINQDFNIVSWNRCLESWSKKRKAEVIGSSLYDIYPLFREPKYTVRLDTILSGGPPAIFSCQLHAHLYESKLPNGELRILQTTVSNIPGSEPGEFNALFAIQDLTKLSNRIIGYRDLQEKALQEIEYRKIAQVKLRKANEQILKHQKALIEEERLKVLLQMAGATAHELNQPLMILLGQIELLKMDQDNPEMVLKHVKKIEGAGNRISNIVKKIQTVKQVTQKSYATNEEIIDIHQRKKILHVEDDDSCFKMTRMMLEKSGFYNVSRANCVGAAKRQILNNRPDLIILDHQLPDGDAFEILIFLKLQRINLPVIILTGQGNEVMASKFIRHGADDYLTKSSLSRALLTESIEFALEKPCLHQDK
jgi:two-component system cell cycle response regulator